MVYCSTKNAGGYTDVWSRKKTQTQTEARVNRENELLGNFSKMKEGRTAGKSLDNLLSRDYYNDPRKIEKLREAFERDTRDGWFNASVGFESYLSDYVRIEEELVGLKTADGIEIKCQAEHFLTRIYGTIKDPVKGNTRHGVSIDDVKSAIFYGTKTKTSETLEGISFTYTTEKCKVSINPETGTLIQCNPN